jgi:hypothetical protein
MYFVYNSTTADAATVQHFDVMCQKFNVASTVKLGSGFSKKGIMIIIMITHIYIANLKITGRFLSNFRVPRVQEDGTLIELVSIASS